MDEVSSLSNLAAATDENVWQTLQDLVGDPPAEIESYQRGSCEWLNIELQENKKKLEVDRENWVSVVKDCISIINLFLSE